MERIQFIGGEALAAAPEHLASLAAKLHAAQAAIGAVAKDGRNDRFGYSYVSYEALAAEVRQALKKAGLAFFVSMDEPQFSEIKTERSTMTRALVGGAITFMDTDTGAMLSVPWYGEGTDTMDKATAKALTAGVKYLLMRTFLVSDQEDVDGDAEPPTPRQTQQRRQPPAQRPAPAQKRRESQAPAAANDARDSVRPFWQNAELRVEFLSYVHNDCGLSDKEMMEACGVAAMSRFEGSYNDAVAAIQEYIAANA